MSVTRYELTTKYRGNESWDELEENPEGAYVRHGDYAALEQRLIESERYGRQTDITIDNLELKLAQMAAENAGLKAACERVSMWDGFPQATLRSTGEIVPYVVAYGSNGERDYMRNIAALALKETPATDAFLAEVRASGIDQWIASRDGRWNGTTAEAERFAAQLRKGVQS